jgi:clan AA aspartic protease (TIGR02281 family)
MQRTMTLALLLLACCVAQAETILLIHEHGTFMVPVVINDKITLNFTVDSGAADVSIPADVFSTLTRTGTISKRDLLGTQLYELADGSQHSSQRFRIRSLRVGNLEIRDVIGSVAPSAGSLLLGQSFLEQFRSWSIDNTRHSLILNESPGSRPPTSEAAHPDVSTPADIHEPSYSETMGFVKKKLSEHGVVQYVKVTRNVVENYEFSNAMRASFSVSYVQPCYADLGIIISTDSSSGRSDPSYHKIDFKAVTKIDVVSEVDAANEHHVGSFMVTKISPSMFRVRLHSTGAGDYFVFDDEDIAQRVAKALTHLVELCGGVVNNGVVDNEKEPF